MIERGRWLKVPRIDRLCVCCNKLEDEFHVICECPRYSSIRKLYIKPYYIRKPSIKLLVQLVALLNTDNVPEMQKLAIFIKRALMIHKDCLFNRTEFFLSLNVT